jgi:hypothetical protein
MSLIALLFVKILVLSLSTYMKHKLMNALKIFPSIMLLFLQKSYKLYINKLRLRHYATARKVACSRPDEVSESSVFLILPAALGPGVYSASNRNEYQK